MQSKIFDLNWENFDIDSKEQRMQLGGALQCFFTLPERFVPKKFSKVKEFVEASLLIQKANRTRQQVQEFSLMSDGWTNEKAIDILEKFHLEAEYDNGFEQIFDVRDYSGTKASGFDVADVASGLMFEKLMPGEKAKVYSFGGSKTRCYFDYYAAALGWHRQLFEDGDWWTIEDTAKEFRNRAYHSRAEVYYTLLEAAADAKGCCAVSGGADTLAQIANSLNLAAQTILTDTQNKGYGLNPGTTRFIVLTPIRMRGQIRQALGYRSQNYSDAERVIDYQFTQITSMMLTNPNRVLVILPKKKLKIGYRMDLTPFDDFDILSYTDTVAGWMRHGGCIGDTDQIQCIDFEAVSGSCP